MKQKKYYVSLLSFFLAITILLTSCSSPSIPTNANTAFQNFTRNLFEQDVGMEGEEQLVRRMVIAI